MSEAQYFDEAIRYLAEDMNAEERRAFEEYLASDPLKQQEVDALRKLWEQTGHYEVKAPSTNLAEQWSRFADKAFEAETTVRSMEPWWRKAGKIAAAVIFLLASASTWWFMNSGADVSVAPIVVQAAGETKAFQLPDGSSISLNANSKISYQPDFSNRIVHLEGEAYFDVTHLDSDASFTVQTPNSKTTVLGTSFNVRAYPEEKVVNVDVFEGKVAFAGTKSKPVVLTKDSGAELVKSSLIITRSKSVEPNKLFWKTRELKFEHEALRKILADLRSAYGVEFDVENQVVLDCTWNTSFKDESIEEVLEELEFGLNISIEKKGARRWLISGTSCAPIQ